MDRQTIEAVKLARCSVEEQMRIRDIRNQDSVRHAMYRHHKISPEEHLAWLAKVPQDASLEYFIIRSVTGVIGAVSASKIDRTHLTADWAFFISEGTRGGIGKLIEYHFLNYVFFRAGIKKLNCEVLAFNTSVIEMHKTFGFQQEGIRRQDKLRDAERLDVVLLGITEEEWAARKPAIEAEYQSILSKFNFEMEP